jgi:hypothetical protein
MGGVGSLKMVYLDNFDNFDNEFLNKYKKNLKIKKPYRYVLYTYKLMVI